MTTGITLFKQRQKYSRDQTYPEMDFIYIVSLILSSQVVLIYITSLFQWSNAIYILIICYTDTMLWQALNGDFFIKQCERFTLVAEYTVYNGQGKVLKSEDRFRVRPFWLKFNLNSCILFTLYRIIVKGCMRRKHFFPRSHSSPVILSITLSKHPLFPV